MKKFIKNLCTACCIVALASPLAACGNNKNNTNNDNTNSIANNDSNTDSSTNTNSKKDASSVTESAKSYIDAYLGKSKEASDKIKELTHKRDYNVDVILDGTDGDQATFIKALYTALSKVKYEVKDSKEEGDKAAVTISITPIDINKLKENAFNKTIEEKKSRKVTAKESKTITFNSIVDQLNNIEVKPAKDVTIEFTKNAEGNYELSDAGIVALETGMIEKEGYTKYDGNVSEDFVKVAEAK
ncbi:MAG: hypothetical protein E7214_10690 [Clostridium sp.]|nr:hypothetical protein [Clostridium sp.]